jgi:hypothetical protein
MNTDFIIAAAKSRLPGHRTRSLAAAFGAAFFAPALHPPIGIGQLSGIICVHSGAFESEPYGTSYEPNN